MGRGRQLGEQLERWCREGGGQGRLSGQALANRWSDLLGDDDSLRPPLRDLAHRPLFRQALAQRGAAQRASLEQLGRELQHTYSPAVMAELLDLLEAFAGMPLPRPAGAAAATDRRRAAPTAAPTRSGHGAALAARWLQRSGNVLQRLRRRLEPMAPGIALAAAAALVWMWLGRELDRLLFEGWGWSGGAVLLLLLALIEGLGLLGPLHRWQGAGLLPLGSSATSRQAWRWITAPWQHPSRGQAALNLALLAVILGPSALQLPDVLLRYSLASLATLTLAALVAAKTAATPGEAQQPRPVLVGGASGAVASLIALGVGLSLLQGQQLSYGFGPLSIPAWVLLLLDATLELTWLAHGPGTATAAQETQEKGPALAPGPSARPWNRRQLLSQPWSWGLLLGAGWAVTIRLQQLLVELQQAGPQA